LLILVAAVFVPSSLRFKRILRWMGEHPLWIAGATAAVLCLGAWFVYENLPLSADEYAPYFQSQVFAAGHLTGRVPPALLDWFVPKGFQNMFFHVSHLSGRVISAYWPSFALLLTPFTWLGIPWACNPILSACTIVAIHRLTILLFEDVEAAGLAVLLTVASAMPDAGHRVVLVCSRPISRRNSDPLRVHHRVPVHETYVDHPRPAPGRYLQAVALGRSGAARSRAGWSLALARGSPLPDTDRVSPSHVGGLPVLLGRSGTRLGLQVFSLGLDGFTGADSRCPAPRA
jgi:hypothetical protein